jgi:hypothetical protein
MIILRILCVLAAAGTAITAAEAQTDTRRPPWPPGDEIGMANTLGPNTWQVY